jgi:hypothetical protein
MSGPSIQNRDADALALLATLLADPAVTRVTVRGGGAEIARAGKIVPEPDFLPDPVDLARAIAALLRPGQLIGAVGLRGCRGFAALPPVSDEPLLVLQRPAPLNVSPKIAMDTGLLTARVARVAADLTSRGAGVVLAGPDRGTTTAALSALVQCLSPTLPLVIVEDQTLIARQWEGLRLRDVPDDPEKALLGHFLVVDLASPPSVFALPHALLITAAACTPRAALLGLAMGRGAPLLPPPERAVLLADRLPLILWYDVSPAGSHLAAVYEALPVPDRQGGACALQALLEAAPGNSHLLGTGAIPRDALLAAVVA